MPSASVCLPFPTVYTQNKAHKPDLKCEETIMIKSGILPQLRKRQMYGIIRENSKFIKSTVRFNVPLYLWSLLNRDIYRGHREESKFLANLLALYDVWLFGFLSSKHAIFSTNGHFESFHAYKFARLNLVHDDICDVWILTVQWKYKLLNLRASLLLSLRSSYTEGLRGADIMQCALQ